MILTLSGSSRVVHSTAKDLVRASYALNISGRPRFSRPTVSVGTYRKSKWDIEANREVIKDPDLIYPGQQIRIP